MSKTIALIRSKVAMGVTDDTWHHVCLSWVGDSGLLSVFKDGERKSDSNGFWSLLQNLGIEGNYWERDF